MSLRKLPYTVTYAAQNPRWCTKLMLVRTERCQHWMADASLTRCGDVYNQQQHKKRLHPFCNFQPEFSFILLTSPGSQFLKYCLLYTDIFLEKLPGPIFSSALKSILFELSLYKIATVHPTKDVVTCCFA